MVTRDALHRQCSGDDGDAGGAFVVVPGEVAARHQTRTCGLKIAGRDQVGGGPEGQRHIGLVAQARRQPIGTAQDKGHRRLAGGLPGPQAAGVACPVLAVEDLYSKSQYLSLHIPATAETNSCE